MSIDPAIAGFAFDPLVVDYDERDAILYALGVGAGGDDDELGLVYEAGLRALPTLPVVFPFGALIRMEELLGIDQSTVLHGEQRLRVHRPVPPRGRADVRTRVSHVWDKGKGAVVDCTAEIAVDGEPVATATYASFVRGGGGFGGERGSGLAAPRFDRPPDHVRSERTATTQALLYRLSGDTNPLHADPAFARGAGFDRPILHGLCTYGFAARMAMHAVADGDPARIAAVDARFTGVVFPGDELRLELWRTGPESASGRVVVPARDAIVIDPLEISTTALGGPSTQR